MIWQQVAQCLAQQPASRRVIGIEQFDSIDNAWEHGRALTYKNSVYQPRPLRVIAEPIPSRGVKVVQKAIGHVRRGRRWTPRCRIRITAGAHAIDSSSRRRFVLRRLKVSVLPDGMVRFGIG